MAGIVVVFDFDKTIVDVDSDNWLVEELGATDLFNRLLPTMPWNSLMDRMMAEFHSQGKTIDDIAGVLNRIPIHPRIIPAIKSAAALGCDLKIVSDANAFFIDTILDHHGLRDYFSEICTNPSFVDDEGRVRIRPRHDFTVSPHGCANPCPPNMCKGSVMERMIAESRKNSRYVYLGDGSGDYCAVLKLGDGDHVMPRRNLPLWELIRGDPKAVKARVHEWSDGRDLERVLLRLLSPAPAPAPSRAHSPSSPAATASVSRERRPPCLQGVKLSPRSSSRSLTSGGGASPQHIMRLTPPAPTRLVTKLGHIM